MDLKNQIVWITGASSGIGRSMALECARQGATVAVSARRLDLLQVLVSEIVNEGGSATAFVCDVMDENSVKSCVDEVIGTFGNLNMVIANAGFGVMGKIEQLTAADWSRQLSCNVTGLALTCKYALPHLKKSQGNIGLIGSVGAFLPGPKMGAYSASKAAVHSIGETLQVELLGSGVSCTTIHPGFVQSNITRIDNEGNFNPSAEDPRPANLMWPTDKAAKVMIEAIKRRKKVFVFTGHGKLAVFLGKYFPSIARKMMAKTGS